MRSVIHVHQQEVRKRDPQQHPAIIVRNYKGSTHHTDVTIIGPSRIIHSNTADRCGARVWSETDSEVITNA
jgi:hypothetical protein